jgi:hypothetical protein
MIQVLIRSAISMALVAGLVALGMRYMQAPVTRPAVEIEASQDTLTNVVPVFAQFVVTQTLHLDTAGPVTHIELPVYEMALGQRLQVTLRGQQTVGEWDLMTTARGEVVPVQLSLSPAQMLTGDFELTIAAGSISHEDKDIAPQLFIQTADDYYPDGNYRIANNEKSGDVALVMFERVTNWQEYQEDWRHQPLNAVKFGLLVALTLLLAASVGWLKLSPLSQQKNGSTSG